MLRLFAISLVPCRLYVFDLRTLMYVRSMYACMYISMYVCMYDVCTYVFIYVFMHEFISVRMDGLRNTFFSLARLPQRLGK